MIGTANIEPARAEDAPRLTTLARTSGAYAGEYRVMVADQNLDARYIQANPVRVARDPHGAVVGFYSLLIPGRGRPGEAELDWIMVADEAQGRGVGRALFSDMVHLVRELSLARVHIVSHPPSEGFYLAQGARRIAMIPPGGRATWSRPHLVLDL